MGTTFYIYVLERSIANKRWKKKTNKRSKEEKKEEYEENENGGMKKRYTSKFSRYFIAREGSTLLGQLKSTMVKPRNAY